ncbi:hypothetical protein [Paludisphaera mucosa]|uniref:Uncharacterized protein n=1 Tax=Paludisphaera mucosa TaxID=3030827 RepID=A0ABT6FGT5_9BACT|nr:hypothetical protein [Paludisphaera mucosa]MDG3006595.1 hypothetical protein [Paludisphaera mucosa]
MKNSVLRDGGRAFGLGLLAFATGFGMGCDSSKQGGTQVQVSDEDRALVNARKESYAARAKEKAAARTTKKH